MMQNWGASLVFKERNGSAVSSDSTLSINLMEPTKVR